VAARNWIRTPPRLPISLSQSVGDRPTYFSEHIPDRLGQLVTHAALSSDRVRLVSTQ